MGKTRLALELLARRPLDEDVVFVDASAVEDVDDLVRALARELEVSDETRIEAALVERGRSVWLVLDAVDRSVDVMRELLPRWMVLPRVTIVLTSRRRVDVALERVYEVPLLATNPRSTESLSPAAQLFCERAREVGGEVEPLEDVEAIASLLEGLPIAIELAASRTRLLSPSDLKRHLTASFSLDVLDDPARSLRARMGASVHALGDDERAALQSLSVLSSRLGVALAELIVRERIEGPSISVLQSLRERSLIGVEEAVGLEGRRLRVFAIVRALILEEATEAELRSARRAFARAVSELSQRALSDAWGSASGEALRLVASDDEGLEEVIALAESDHELINAAIQAAAALIDCREALGRAQTLPSIVARALALGDAHQSDPQSLATFEAHASVMLAKMGERERADQLSRSAERHAHGVPALIARVLLMRARTMGRKDAEAVVGAALEAAPQDSVIAALGEELLAAATRRELDLDAALLHAERMHAYARAPSAPRIVGRAVLMRASVLADRADSQRALALAVEARALSDAALERRAAGRAWLLASLLALELGRIEEAERHVRDALVRGRELEDDELVLDGQLTLAAIHFAGGDFEAAEDALVEASLRVNATTAPAHGAATRCLRTALSAMTGRPMPSKMPHHEGEVPHRDFIDGLAATIEEVGRAKLALVRGNDDESILSRARARLEALRRRAEQLAPDGRVPSVVLRVGLMLVERTLDVYAPPARALAIDVHQRLVRLPHRADVIDLSESPMLFRLLLALVRTHERATTLIDRDALVAEVWPGEKIATKAAQNRLFVALHKLKTLGFEGLFETHEAGTSLVRDLYVVRAARLTPPPRSLRGRRRTEP